jgi:hypothetical protein
MGRLRFFTHRPAPAPMRLASGCFTVDRDGQLIVSTLPQTFSPDLLNRIARAVLQTFRSAKAARVVLTEIQAHYPALKITARELRGGAIVFVAPLASGKSAAAPSA